MAVNVRSIAGETDNHWRSTIPGLHYNGDRELARQYRQYAKQETEKFVDMLRAGGQRSGRRRLPLPPNPVNGVLYRGFISLTAYEDGTRNGYIYAVREPVKRKRTVRAKVNDIVGGYLTMFRAMSCWTDPGNDFIPSFARWVIPDRISSSELSGSRYWYTKANKANRFGTNFDPYNDAIRPGVMDYVFLSSGTQTPWNMHRYIKASMYSGHARKVVQLLLGVGDIANIPYNQDPCVVWGDDPLSVLAKEKDHAELLNRIDTAHKKLIPDHSDRVVKSGVRKEGFYSIEADGDYQGQRKSSLIDYLNTDGKGTWALSDFDIDDPAKTPPPRNGPPYIAWDYRWIATDGVLFDSEGEAWHCHVSPLLGVLAMPLQYDPAWDNGLVRDWVDEQIKYGNNTEWVTHWSTLRDNFFKKRDGSEKHVKKLNGFPLGERFPQHVAAWVNSGYMIRIATVEQMGKWLSKARAYNESVGWCFDYSGTRIANTGWAETGTNYFTGYSWEYSIRIGKTRKPDQPPPGLDLAFVMDPNWKPGIKRAIAMKLRWMSEAAMHRMAAMPSMESRQNFIRDLVNEPIAGSVFTAVEKKARVFGTGKFFKVADYEFGPCLNTYLDAPFSPATPTPSTDGSAGESNTEVKMFVFYDENDTLQYISMKHDTSPDAVETTTGKESACYSHDRTSVTRTEDAELKPMGYQDSVGKNEKAHTRYLRTMYRLTPDLYKHMTYTEQEGKGWEEVVAKPVTPGKFRDMRGTFVLNGGNGIPGGAMYRAVQRAYITDHVQGAQVFLRYVVPMYERCAYFKYKGEWADSHDHSETFNWVTQPGATYSLDYVNPHVDGRWQVISTGLYGGGSDPCVYNAGVDFTYSVGTVYDIVPTYRAARLYREGNPVSQDRIPYINEGFEGYEGCWLSDMTIPNDFSWSALRKYKKKLTLVDAAGKKNEVYNETAEYPPGTNVYDLLGEWDAPAIDYGDPPSWPPSVQYMSASKSAFSDAIIYNTDINNSAFKVYTDFTGHDGKSGARVTAFSWCISFIGLV